MSAPKANNKQLLDEAEHDINNYSDVLSLRSMLSEVEADNTDRGLNNY